MLGAGFPSNSQVGVGEVGDHPDVLAVAEAHDLFVERQVDRRRGRVVREVDDQALGLARRARERGLDLLEVILAGADRDRHRLAAGDDHAEAVDRIAGVGREHAVARADQREQQVRQAFLGADGDHRLAIGIEALAVAALVPVADRAAGLGQPLRRHVALVAGAARLVDQAVDHRMGARPVGVAEAEVEHVVALGAQLRLQLVDGREHVRRQRRQARE